MITLTPEAQAKLIEHCDNRGADTLGVHIDIRATGCSGFAYHLEFVHKPLENAKTTPINDQYQIYINEQHEYLFQGVTMHHTTQGLNSGFDFINPNEAARCGCGESFTV